MTFAERVLNERIIRTRQVGKRHKFISLSPVYTIQPVVKPVVNRIDNRLYRVYKHSTGCQTRLTTGLTNGYIVYTAGCQTGCTTGFTTGCIV